MAENKGVEFLDAVVMVVRWKKLLLTMLVAVFVLSYLAVYFLIPSEYTATATIVPSEDNSLGGLSVLMKNFSSLPMGLGGSKKSSELDLYTTIVKSRMTCEYLLDEFRLDTLYRFENREEACKDIRKLVNVDITTENAYVIEVRARAPVLAAAMTNALVKRINEKIIDLNVAKSRENRLFLEQRTNEIRRDLRKAEDSLKWYQSTQGVYEAKEQVKATLSALTELESQLAIKEVEFALVRKVYGEDSPQFSNAQVSVQEFTSKLNELKQGKDPSSLLLAIDKIPAKALNYFRLYREVEIGNKLLEFIIPLYEQAKFEEMKETPILQVIDPAVAPIKRSYPKRTLLAGLITLAALTATLCTLILRDVISLSSNPRLVFIRQEMFKLWERR
jgi:tyrosine-protein kinase Etk/Wzc